MGPVAVCYDRISHCVIRTRLSDNNQFYARKSLEIMEETKKRSRDAPSSQEEGEDGAVLEDEDDVPPEDDSSEDPSDVEGGGDDGDRKVAALPTVLLGGGSGANANPIAGVPVAQEQGQGQKLSPQKRMRTSAAGSLENSKVSHEQRWNEMFSRVLAFKQIHGALS